MARTIAFTCLIAMVCVESHAHDAPPAGSRSMQPASGFLPGDVNGDGLVNAVDVQLVVNAALGIDISPHDADGNRDGQVNAVDVQLVTNVALGIEVPTAAFSADPQSGAAPLDVQFTDASTAGSDAITSWLWNFGDGGTSTEQNPSHTYVSEGTYTVSLTVASSTGSDTETKTGLIAVTPSETETILLPDNVPLEMVWIEPGTFMMGRYPEEQDSYTNEDPQHSVTVAGFWMGKYELTKAQWTAVMGTKPWDGRGGVLDDPDSPAVHVSWNDAQDFINALNNYTGKTFRLPSEAEWEYACRAGTTTRFYWGDDPSYTAGDDYAWWRYNAADVNEEYAHIVGQKLPNAWGLYDMIGNVWEWCEDDWHWDYTGAPSDGSAWVDSPRASDRVLRGGTLYSSGQLCRSAFRYNNIPSRTGNSRGFRLAR